MLKLGRDRLLAHQVLFRHRHSDQTPDFHRELIGLWHSRVPRVGVMAFREAGKSTIAEEAITVGAEYQLFRNAIIVGSTEKRACERLRAVKHEIETNELLEQLFDHQVGRTWNEAEIILANGVRIIAVGRGQSLRGTKHLHYRPDFCFCDDIEDKEHVGTPEARDDTQAWFMDELMPALDKDARVRMNATPLDRDSLPMRMRRWDAWLWRVYPIEHVDQDGERRATWEARYPLDWIDAKRREYEQAGDLEGYAREYLCVAEDPRRKIFTSGMFPTEPRVCTWQPTYCMYDPARTTRQTSATTGWAVWSWIANRLVVWDGGGELWKPDEIVRHLFETNDTYEPVSVGVEEDGLNEWLLQPLRHEMLRRGVVLPLAAQKAPKGKISFIEGLQPFCLAGEVSFAKDLPVLTQQFMSFPTGRIDGPNALAYAPRMRPGVVVYDNFSAGCVADDLRVRVRAPVWLCLNADAGLTTAVGVQLVDGALHVLADYAREGDPGATLRDIVQAAALDIGEVRLVAGPRHYAAFDRLGLRGAVAKLPADLRRGTSEEMGRAELRALFRTHTRGRPSCLVAPAARRTLNALSAGYAFAVDRRGQVGTDTVPGLYRTLMEGLEAFAGLLKIGISDDRGRANLRTTEGGQSYVSALPGRASVALSKDEYLRAGAVSDVGALSAKR